MITYDLRTSSDLKDILNDVIDKANKIKNEIEDGKEINTDDVLALLSQAEHFIFTGSVVYGINLDYREEIGGELNRYKRAIRNNTADVGDMYIAVCYTLELFKKLKKLYV